MYQKYWEKFPSVFGGHFISMNIPPRKGERHYAYSLGSRQDLKYAYKPIPQEWRVWDLTVTCRCKIPHTLKE
jgi:hypothetical protein